MNYIFNSNIIIMYGPNRTLSEVHHITIFIDLLFFAPWSVLFSRNGLSSPHQTKLFQSTALFPQTI